MVVTATPTNVTADQLAELPNSDLFELVRGNLVKRSLSPKSAFVGNEIYCQFRDYAKQRPGFGFAFADGLDFLIVSDDEGDTVRKPDAAFVLMGRIPNGKLPEKRFDFSPDLAVEVLSPTDISFDVEAKIQEYLDAGTQIVWLAKPKSRRISVYRPDGTEVTFGPNDTITAEPVLPGFSMRVGDVFPT
jgi:Uma2 family endonuclease